MNRFSFSISGFSNLSDDDFFVDGEGDVEQVLENVSLRDLLLDWNLIEDVKVTLTDNETFKVYELVDIDTWEVITPGTIDGYE